MRGSRVIASTAHAMLSQIEVEASHFWSADLAEEWLFNPNPRLGRRSPIDLMSSDPREVWYALLADAQPGFEGD